MSDQSTPSFGWHFIPAAADADAYTAAAYAAYLDGLLREAIGIDAEVDE